MDNDIATNEALKAIPPVGVSTLSILGVPMSDVVYIMTVIYLCVQITCILYRTFYKKESGPN